MDYFSPNPPNPLNPRFIKIPKQEEKEWNVRLKKISRAATAPMNRAAGRVSAATAFNIIGGWESFRPVFSRMM